MSYLMFALLLLTGSFALLLTMRRHVEPDAKKRPLEPL